MSNKQKFLSVLAAMVQPQVKNPRRAWSESEKAFDEHVKLMKEFSHEELSEMVVYSMMSMLVLSDQGSDLFLSVVLDDLKVVVHDRTCEKCSGKEKSGTPAENAAKNVGGDAGSEGESRMRLFSSLDELVGSIRGTKKPPN